MENVIKDRRVVVIDDTIVRGTTSANIIHLLRETGAREVHLCISSPPLPTLVITGLIPRSGKISLPPAILWKRSGVTLGLIP